MYNERTHNEVAHNVSNLFDADMLEKLPVTEKFADPYDPAVLAPAPVAAEHARLEEQRSNCRIRWDRQHHVLAFAA